jgi:hypothetical protein
VDKSPPLLGQRTAGSPPLIYRKSAGKLMVRCGCWICGPSQKGCVRKRKRHRHAPRWTPHELPVGYLAPEEDLRPAPAECFAEQESDSDVDEEGPDPFDSAENKFDQVTADLILEMFDWMGEHKMTWAGHEGAWTMLQRLMPNYLVQWPTYTYVKSILVAYLQDRVLKVDCCRNDCVAYHDPVSSAFSGPEYMNAGVQECPHCLEPRYVGEGVHRRASKVPGSPLEVLWMSSDINP